MPPGWYTDPQGLVRWWDGWQWTPTTQPHEAPRSSRGGVGVLGLLLTCAGAAAVAIAFTSVDWLNFHLGTPGDTFDMQAIAHDPSTDGFGSAYCQWLGWLLLVVPALTAVAACLPVPNRRAVHVGTIAVSLLALAVTIGAVTSVVRAAGGGDVIDAGPWLAVAGFAGLFLGAVTATVGARP